MTTSQFTDNTIKRAVPSDWPSRHREQDRRENVVAMGPYPDADKQRLGLFQGTDGGNNIIHDAQRISPLIRYVATVNALVLSREWTLNLRPDADPPPAENDARLSMGMRTWRRSQVAKLARRCAMDLATVGDCYIEAGITAAKEPVIVRHRPQHVSVWLDSLGLDIVRAVIEYDDEDRRAGNEGQRVRVKRTLTPERITVERDDAAPVTADNPLGVVPLLWVQYQPGPDPQGLQGLPPWWGLEDAVAVHDSATTIMTVIGTKVASPTLFGKGMRFSGDGGTDAAAVEGKVVTVPNKDASLEFLEPSMAGLQGLHERAEGVHRIAASTAPELLFTDSGANASGTALSTLASSFVAKVGPVDADLRAAVGTALAMAHALASNTAWTDALDVYDVTAGPLLPVDVGARVDVLVKAHDLGLVKPVDIVKGLQDVDVVPRDADPEKYATEAIGQDRERTSAAADAIGRASRPAPAMRAAPPEDTPEDDVEDSSNDGPQPPQA